jgi:hypothetical protein
MKSSTRRTDCALVIGFYQSPQITGTALTKLRRDGFRRSAAMHCAATGEVRVDEHGIGAGRGAWGAALIGLLLGIAVLLPPHPTEQPGAIPGLALQLAACWLVRSRGGGCFGRWTRVSMGRIWRGSSDGLSAMRPSSW